MKIQILPPRETVDPTLLRKELEAALAAPAGDGWGGVITDQSVEVVLFPERETDAALIPTVVNAHIAAAPQRKADAVATAEADTAAAAAAKANAVVQYLVSHTPVECAAYVNTNVTNFAQAKEMLANFAVALCVLARRELRNGG